MCVCVCVCVCVHAHVYNYVMCVSTIITNGVIWTLYDWLNKLQIMMLHGITFVWYLVFIYWNISFCCLVI